MNLLLACRYGLLLLWLSSGLILAQGLWQPFPPEDAAAALDRLPLLRNGLMVQAIGPEDLGQGMLQLGMWEELSNLLAGQPADRMRGLRIELALKQHRYPAAQALVDAWLTERPTDPEARLFSARLDLQAWRLDRARATTLALLEDNRRDARALLLLGQVELLEKSYRKALSRAEQVIQWDSTDAE